MKRILMITTGVPASDRTGWSGTPFSLMNTLKKYYEIEEYCLDKKSSLMALTRTFYERKLRHRFVSLPMLKSFARKASKLLQQELKGKNIDLILATHPTSAGAVAYLETSIPVLFYSDCVFSSMYDYYWFNVAEHIKKEMDYVLKRALDKSKAIVFTSDWAKNAAIKDYYTAEGKIHVVPLGANVETQSFAPKAHEGINLLFVGKDWDRKGADIAIEAVQALKTFDPAQRYRLDIVGCNAPRIIDCDNVTIHGFINRNNENERHKLDDLRANADIFILPTKAECAGIVFCEACAYSIPSLTFDTGGIPNYVINGFNGYRLPMGSSGEAFARKIVEIVNDRSELAKMKKNARQLYEDVLNWDKASTSIEAIIEACVK